MRGRRTAWAAGVILTVVLAGCAAPAGKPPPRPTATPVAAIICPATNAAPAAGAVPAEFTAVAVFRCDDFALQDDARGTWSGTRTTEFTGDLAPLLAALAAPDDPPTTGACPAIGFAGPTLWLSDAAGRFVHVAYPVDACGMPRTDAVFAALSRLTVVDEHFQPRRLVDSSAARQAGCPSTGQGLKAAMVPERAAPQLPEAGPLTLCRYASEPPASNAPDASVSSPVFVGARRLDAAAARRVLAAAAAARPAAECHVEASRIVVLVPAARPDRTVVVELDKCRNFADLQYRTFTAPDALLALLAAD